jgi:hypothetical protein
MTRKENLMSHLTTARQLMTRRAVLAIICTGACLGPAAIAHANTDTLAGSTPQTIAALEQQLEAGGAADSLVLVAVEELANDQNDDLQQIMNMIQAQTAAKQAMRGFSGPSRDAQPSS